jgi:hypothetical protein
MPVKSNDSLIQFIDESPEWPAETCKGGLKAV